MSDVLILGAGISGLTAGIYCLKEGHNVTICEQHTIPGGNLTGWNRQKLHIDNCIHWLTGTNKHSKFNQIWNDIGALGDDIPLIKEDSLYTYKKDNLSVSLYRDLNKTIEEMLAISPEDEKEIRKLEKAIHILERFSHTGGECFNKGINGFTLLKSPSLLQFWKLSTKEYGELYKSPILQGFFEGILGPDFSAISFVMIAATYCSGNGDIPKGGSFLMAQRVAKKFKDLGGTLKFSKKACKANIEGNKVVSVTFEDGETLKADNVIVTFEPKMFFGKVIDKKLPNIFQKVYKKFKRFSTIQTAFSIPEDILSFNGSTTFDIPLKYQELLKSDKIVLRDSSYEKAFSKEGKKVLQTMIYVNEETARYFVELAKKDKSLYKEEKAKLGVIQKEIICELLPSLKNNIELIDNWTPASYSRYVGTEVGSWMSFIIPAKKVPIFIKHKVEKIKNLYFASQWNMMPGGLPYAALSGKKVVKYIK